MGTCGKLVFTVLYVVTQPPRSLQEFKQNTKMSVACGHMPKWTTHNLKPTKYWRRRTCALITWVYEMVTGRLILWDLVLRILRCEMLSDTCMYRYYMRWPHLLKLKPANTAAVLAWDSPTVTYWLFNPTWKLHPDSSHDIVRPVRCTCTWATIDHCGCQENLEAGKKTQKE